MMRVLNWSSISMTAAIGGLAVATYLTIIHYDREALVCGLGDCQTVQNSQYAVVAGVPIALLGLLMYLSVIGLGIARLRRSTWESSLTMIAFTLVLAGSLYAAYLTYLELVVIRAICEWCVTSAVLTVFILITEGFGLGRILLRSPVE